MRLQREEPAQPGGLLAHGSLYELSITVAVLLLALLLALLGVAEKAERCAGFRHGEAAPLVH